MQCPNASQKRAAFVVQEPRVLAMNALHCKPFIPCLTLFSAVDRESKVFASLDVPDVVSTVGQESDVHVLVRAELLQPCVRSSNKMDFRVCEYRENMPWCGFNLRISANVSVETPLLLVNGYKALRDQARSCSCLDTAEPNLMYVEHSWVLGFPMVAERNIP